MKRTSVSETPTATLHDMQPEYNFDYAKARPNRFAARRKDRLVVLLDPDISQVFTDSEAVNKALRAILSAMPRATAREAALA